MAHADFLIVNGNVFTADPLRPFVRALAIRGKRIVWVGDEAGARDWRGAQTEVIDAGGATVMPGIIDSHFHLLWGSTRAAELQLDGAQTLDDLAEMARAWAAAKAGDGWIVGHQLNYALVPAGRVLDRHFLDGIVADRPLLFFSYDTHTAWANTLALQMGDLLQGREVAAGSVIVMGAEGLATGELREPGAYEPLRRLIPKPTVAQQRRLLRQGLAQAAQAGITSVHNMDGDAEQIELYAEMEAAGELTLRVYMPLSVTPQSPLEMLQSAQAWKQRYQGGYLHAGAVKLFMDGVLESYTGFLLDDYADRPGERGDALFGADHFGQLAVEADQLGLQIVAHCCGDGAVRRALDGYALAQGVNGRRDSRHRIEHIELVHDDDMARFAELGVIGSMQPFHVPAGVGGGDVWPQRVGRERWPLSFAWQTLRAAGMRHAFGSDWPVVSMNPMLGIDAATNRQAWAAGDPVQRQTLHDTLVGYTRDGAYAEFREHDKGVLAAGMVADVVVMDCDLFAAPHDALRHAKPRLTLCDGRVVWRDGV